MPMELLLIVGGLALLDMISPVALGVTFYWITEKRSDIVEKLSIYLATIAVLYFSFGLLLLLGLDFLLDNVADLLQIKIISWFVFLIGITLFVISFYVPKKRSTLVPANRGPIHRGHALFLGVFTFLLEAGTALPYIAATGIIAAADSTWGQNLALLGGYNLLMILPCILLYMLFHFAGASVKEKASALLQKLEQSTGSTLSWILCLAGLVLVYYTVDYL
ncbi:Sap, sulfolipid-1-addressing protein [Terribacillus halophilus]|uniref:Sap, sulfolipid-1-addressing protein n=1 Tax=Terribacillus halophilus TaxID=361279 RepID=A0A1G6QCU7_9BACI|nr:GAP family protein [Terribacillus halophilus]SDC90123.1 Sap, sulfolipid-1-addressing protein [Terribacillus halophilus]